MRKYIFFQIIVVSLFGFLVMRGQEPKSGNNKSTKSLSCDFSEYATVPIEHFTSDAVVRTVQPKYPKEARGGMTEGSVSVKVLINRRGIVERACAAHGNPIFFSSAEAAALKWRFKPKYGLAFSSETNHKNRKIYASTFIEFTFRFPNKS